MSRWNLKASSLCILGCVVVLMLLIVVLPDVDLPDVAFHRENAPLLVHIHANAAPAGLAVAIVFQLPDALRTSGLRYQAKAVVATPHPNFRPILLCSIRC
jgi:hypothetical protein